MEHGKNRNFDRRNNGKGRDFKKGAPHRDNERQRFTEELDPFLDAIKTGKVDRDLDYLKYPVALIDATIRAFTEDKEIAITVPEI